MGTVLLIIQGVNLLISEIVPIEELIAKIKGYFTLNPNAAITIQSLTSAALQADENTLALVAKWQAEHNLPVTEPDPAAASTPIAIVPPPAAPGS